MRLLHRALAAALLAAALSGTVRAGDDRTVEYPLKAAFLSHFIRYVEWPAGTDALVVAVLGDDPFGPALERALGERAPGGRTVVVRRYRTADQVGPCAILFVARSAMKQWPELRPRLQGRPVLTVGEVEGFTAAGGAVNFFVEEHRLRFEVNRAVTEEAGLRLSSRLLSLARLTPAGAQESNAR